MHVRENVPKWRTYDHVYSFLLGQCAEDSFSRKQPGSLRIIKISYLPQIVYLWVCVHGGNNFYAFDLLLFGIFCHSQQNLAING